MKKLLLLAGLAAVALGGCGDQGSAAKKPVNPTVSRVTLPPMPGATPFKQKFEPAPSAEALSKSFDAAKKNPPTNALAGPASSLGSAPAGVVKP